MAVKATAKNDPFENDPFEGASDQNDTGGDEAQTDVWGAGDGSKATTVVVPAPEGKVTVTLKGGIGYGVPWVVIHANDVPDALAQMSDTQLPALLEKAQKATEFFASKEVKPTPTETPQGGSQTRSGQPAASGAGQGGATRSCKHGQMVARSGVSQKTGKAWSGFFCPTPKDTPDQCKAQFD